MFSPRFSALALLLLIGQTLPSHTPPLSREVSSLVEQVRALPPEFHADLLLRLAASSLVSDPAIKQAWIEEGYWSGAHATLPYMQKADERSDSVDTNSVRANRLEALTLQAKAVEAMLPLNSRKALRLFEQISFPDLLKLACASSFTPDPVDYYQAAVLVFDQSFTGPQRAKEEDIALLRQVIVSVQSPAQVPPAIEMLSVVKLTPIQRRDLFSSLATELQEISRSDREYGAAEGRLVSALTLIQFQPADAAVFLPGLRSYIARHVSGRRCTEYLPATGKLSKSAEQFNRLVDKFDPAGSRYRKFSVEEAKPAGDDGSYPRNLFGQSPQSQDITDALRWLTHGNRVRDGKVVRWTAEERSSRDWLTHYDDSSRLVHEFKESNEKSPEAFFCMKADALNILSTLAPAGPAREKAIDEYREFLEQSYASIENPNLWFTMFRHMLYTARFSDTPKDRTWLLEELSRSLSPIIALYAKLETRLGPPTETYPPMHVEAAHK